MEAEVVVLDDSSEASSDAEMPTVSASSLLHGKCVQSTGYANAVQAALAMAAALDTNEPSSRLSSLKKKGRANFAPPLSSTKLRKQPLQQRTGDSLLRTANNRETGSFEKASRSHKKRERLGIAASSGNISCTMSSNHASDSNFRCCSGLFYHHRPGVNRAEINNQSQPSNSVPIDKPTEGKRLRLNTREICRKQVNLRRRPLGKGLPSDKNKKPAEVVDLLSSSSSSSPEQRIIRSMSLSSLSSSDTESFTLARDDICKKRVEANTRVHKGTVVQLRRECNGIRVGSKVRIHQLMGEKSSTKNKTVSSDQSPEPQSKVLTATRSFSNSELSSPSVVSSDKSLLVNDMFPMKTLTTPREPFSTIRLARKDYTSVKEQSRCRKSVSADTDAPRGNVTTVSPSSETAASEISLHFQEPSPRLRKKRRVFSGFNPEHIALDDLQAQERELAWIQSQRKQIQQSSRIRDSVTQRQKPDSEVASISQYINGKSTIKWKAMACCDDQQSQSKSKGKAISNANPASLLDDFNVILHPTSYRGLYFEKSPINILSLCGQTCNPPFKWDNDHPLVFYDETGTIASQCAILESFGKPIQCVPSIFPIEVKPHREITSSLRSLLKTHLPTIRSCHQRKLKAILTEARAKVAGYQVALKKHEHSQPISRLFPRLSAEKVALRRYKSVQSLNCHTTKKVTFHIDHCEGHVREVNVLSLVQVINFRKTGCLRKSTTSIGLRANYRVDDNPIMRYAGCERSTEAVNGDRGSELAKKLGLRIGSIADEEITEFVLRLVIRCLGDSEQVFNALKSELNFSQAYTAYSELKKLYESRQQAKVRLDWVTTLCHDGLNAQNSNISGFVKLLDKSNLLKGNCTLSWRLLSPTWSLKSSIIDSLEGDTAVSSTSLGLRSTELYNELVDVFSSSFCRVCYLYNCHEHGGDHPLPARRVDPNYPQLELMARHATTIRSSLEVALSTDDVICLDSNLPGKRRCFDGAVDNSSQKSAEIQGEVIFGLPENDEDPNQYSLQYQRRLKCKAMVDPSEYVESSHVSLVAARMHIFLSLNSACGTMCWKNENIQPMTALLTSLSAAEIGLIRKLRGTMGDNTCLLSAIVGSISCITVRELIKKQSKDMLVVEGDNFRRKGCRARNWKQGRRAGGSNHELFQRTRMHRLQDRGTENHEYQPCMHEGMCDSTGCSCMKRDHMCEKACACSRDCPNRFEGCWCTPGNCHTSKCPCFAALRECDPDVCIVCGASDVAAFQSTDSIVHGKLKKMTCNNVNVLLRKHKRLSLSFSSIHGYGMFARESILATEFVYEYTGAMLSQDEAERRGLIYDKLEMSYLFDLNEDAVLDAIRCGNKSKFINHESDSPNCTAKVLSVCGAHHITIWALRDIAVGEELRFDYGYKRSVGPDWSQLQAASKVA
ncbi:hypothetical protein CCR75_003104 [Bremia lactucae]|uniref:Uncharacterized protein n=1 Tax=Bremia lactucae TaxID=4779 RepID=A0A976FHU6_BRELC|nr:hypothetical protein CCR75_003104 [Bremia lactucae]